MKTLIALAALAFAAPALAEDPPMPRMFKGMQSQQKGQYRIEVLESDSGKTPQMTICTDNLMRQAQAERGKSKGTSRSSDPSCKHRLLKDTADEATLETVCKDRTTTVNMKREGAKSMLMTVASTGKNGPHNIKMRYTHLGACREGQSTVTLDANSDECRKIRAQAAKMDPAKQCASAKSDRAQCEQRMRDAVAQMTAMCR